jgi:transposase
MDVMEFEDCGLRVTRVLRNGHRRFDAASKDRLVSACLRPGASISGLALAHGVNANLLRKWVGKRLAQGSTAPGSFVAVQLGGGGRRGDADGGVMVGARYRDGSGEEPVSCLASVGAAAREVGCAAGVTRATAWLPNGVKLVLDSDGSLDVGAVLEALAHVPSGR